MYQWSVPFYFWSSSPIYRCAIISPSWLASSFWQWLKYYKHFYSFYVNINSNFLCKIPNVGVAGLCGEIYNNFLKNCWRVSKWPVDAHWQCMPLPSVLHILTSPWWCHLFVCLHSNRFIVVSQCNFNVHFLMTNSFESLYVPVCHLTSLWCVSSHPWPYFN